MAQARTLGIPVFEASEVNEDGHFVADQVHEETVRPTRHQRREERKREYRKSPRGLREAEARARAAEDQALRAAAVAGDPTAQLRLDSRNAGMALMSGLRRSGIVREGVSLKEQRQKFSAWQKAYASTMVFNCLRPLRGGLNAHSVLETVGISTMMWMCSPVFRAQVGEQLGGVYNSITEQLARHGEGKARAKEARALDKGRSRDNIRRKYRRRLERIERMDRHGLPPFTAQSAALMEIGIAESAYVQMRRIGTDVGAVAEQHQRALRELYAMAQKDGVEPGEISQQMRLIIATRLKAEPNLTVVFSELAHGRFVPDQTGQFVEVGTGHYVDRGSFGVRQPMTTNEHVETTSTAFRSMLTEAAAEGPEAIEAQMYLISLGLQTSTYPETADLVEDPVIGKQLSRSRSLFQAMADDGLTEANAQEIYTRSFLGVIGEIASKSPIFADSWFGDEGVQWRQRLAEQLRVFEKFGQQAQAHVREQRKQARKNGSVQYEASNMWGEEYGSFEAVAVVLDKNGKPRSVRDKAATGFEYESGEDIVDAETVEDTVLPTTKFPDVPTFIVPTFPENTSQQEIECELIERMSDTMAQDITDSAHLNGGANLAGNSWLPRSVYGSPRSALEVAEHPSLRSESVLFADDAVYQRAKLMLTMREEMQRVGMSDAEQDLMFSAAYVRSLEKAVAADPLYEHVVQQAASSPTSEGWQEIEFSRVVAQTHTASARGTSYYAFVSAQGMDPKGEALIAEQAPVQRTQLHETQAAFMNLIPTALKKGLFNPFSRQWAEERRRRWQQRTAWRGAINREYNAEIKDGKVVDLDPGMQFTITD
ncbi:MAG: hypothetical protein B5766_05330 [Candidatus Lumbricidophila eiseniae]|uniref:Uncharacterized protein n=1 Tax=Candidatus Lumbricidiphila eiseniae TaxID=1969409 RepID=A0A2A6FS37_9MICO|nr:MAG: hypothetical protein B5766_05330 [Candidatus Lumbricidophila eiseniae]